MTMKPANWLAIIYLLVLNFQLLAQGNLLVTPKRVVFEGRQQQAELNLMNIGADTATFSVSFRHYNMTEQGKLVLNEKPDSSQMFADPYIRIYPRVVILAPNESQIVVLQYRRKATMAEGEYRSHIWFRSEKDYEALAKEKVSADSSRMSVSVVAIFGITIPVIIRVGQVNVSATISEFKLNSQQVNSKELHFTIHREGNYSVYGNVIVECVPEKGNPFQIGIVKSLGIYTNIEKRRVIVRLKYPSGRSPENGKLRIRFTSPDEEKFAIYAEEVISMVELEKMNKIIL